MVGIRRETVWRNGGFPPIEACTVREWLARKDPFRVTAKKLPVNGRLKSRSSDAPRLHFYFRWVEPSVENILTQHDISYTDFRFEFQYLPHEENEGQDVLVVDSPDTDTKSWPAAARDLLALFRIYRSKKTARGVDVEIRNPDMMYDDTSVEVPPDEDLTKEITRIEPKITDVVDGMMKDVSLSASFHSRVRRGSPDDTSGKLTLMVFCRPDRVFDYQRAEDEILHILGNTSLEVHLEFFPYRIKRRSNNTANDRGDARRN